MTDKKRSFVMYHDYIGHFEMLPKDEQADLIMLILRYVNGFDLSMDQYSGAVKMAFSFIKQRLDDDYIKYTETCRKRSEAAKASKCKQMHAIATDNDNVNENVNVNVNDNENVNVNESENVCVSEVVDDSLTQPPETAACENSTTTTETTVPRKMDFTAPSVSEVREYCEIRNNNIDPQRFVDYYSTNGWKVGNNPMKDWKAAIRIWETRQIPTTTPQYREKRSPPSYDIGAVSERTMQKYRNL